MANNKEDINMREIIKNVVNENKVGLTPEELKREEEAMIKIFEMGFFPAEALGFSQEFLDYVYKYAYVLYQQNKIEEASQLYRWLKLMDPSDLIYTIALNSMLYSTEKLARCRSLPHGTGLFGPRRSYAICQNE